MASDQQLVARILSGDTAAVPELEEKYRGPLVDVAQKHLGMSQHEAEEATQHLFVGLLADDAAPLRSFGWRCALSTWLFALVPRRDPVPARRDSPSGAALLEETAAKAPAAFAGLSDRHRLLLQLSAADGLSYSEIARLVKGSIGEVTSAVYSSKLDFSQALGILPPARVEAEAVAPAPEPVPVAEDVVAAPVEEASAAEQLQVTAAESLADVAGPTPPTEPSAPPQSADVTVALTPPEEHPRQPESGESSGG
jgi:DNA-directed RNA polymerase specialized sigma24 family protein